MARHKRSKQRKFSDPTLKKMYNTYCRQRAQARYRNEEWELDWEAYRDTWGDLFHMRGTSSYSLNLTRIDKNESWHNDNITLQLRRDIIIENNTNHTEEAKAKMSAAKIGKKHTKETKAKLSAAKIGKKHTKETKAKMSAAAKGKR